MGKVQTEPIPRLRSGLAPGFQTKLSLEWGQPAYAVIQWCPTHYVPPLRWAAQNALNLTFLSSSKNADTKSC